MFSNCGISRSSSCADSIQVVSSSFHFSFGVGSRKKLFLTETAGWHRYRKEIFFLIIKVNAFEYPEEEKPYKKDGSVRRTFEGLKRQLWYLLGCFASNGL